MSVMRKSVRFHDNNPSDLEIMHALCNYKNYGFRSESHMIIEALRLFLSDAETHPDPPAEQLAEMIADLVVKRLQSNQPQILMSSSPASAPIKSNDQISDDNIYDTALRFLDTL